MLFGICASYKDVATLNDISFDYLEENVQRFLVPEASQEEFEVHWRVARTLPVPIEAANSLLPASLPIIATPTQSVDLHRLHGYMNNVLRRAEQVGMRVLVFGSGNARACPVGYDRALATQQIGDYLAQWSVQAKEYGIQIALEPLRYEETNTLNTVAESGQLVSQHVDSGATLLVDTYHMACNGEAATDILQWASLLSHVHVAEKQERAAPGRFGEDFRPYFAALHKGGYDRRISIECNWQHLPAEVGPAIATLREQWQTSGM